MIGSRTFSTVPGTSTFFNASLSGVYILGVKREGIGYNLTTGSPGNMQVKNVAGILLFQIGTNFAPGEKIWVLFEQ